VRNPGPDPEVPRSCFREGSRACQGSLWKEGGREGRIKVLDIKVRTKDVLLPHRRYSCFPHFLQGRFADDGIDSPAPRSLCPFGNWIGPRPAVEGGKVLCATGPCPACHAVPPSPYVPTARHPSPGLSWTQRVIIQMAYVMKHLQLSLVDAYLIVALPVVSQCASSSPICRLLYNFVAGGRSSSRAPARRGRRENAAPARFSKRGLNWPYLSRESSSPERKIPALNLGPAPPIRPSYSCFLHFVVLQEGFLHLDPYVHVIAWSISFSGHSVLSLVFCTFM